jgi:hypothetical protein
MREVRRKAQLAARRSLVVLLARSEAIRTNRRCKEGLAHASVTDLVSTYAQAAAVHGRASSEGDYETANIQYRFARRMKVKFSLDSSAAPCESSGWVWATTS